MKPTPRHLWLSLALALALAAPVQAQQPAPRPAGDAPAAERRENRAVEPGALPANSVTRHRLQLPGRELSFTAIAGSMPLVDRAGKVEADIGFVAYLRDDGEDPARRPVTFALNGGPGAASAYLHLGVLGPWRLPLDGPTLPPSSAPVLVPNNETWLDFTDLVFIDPVGTGYSLTRPGTPDDLRNRLLSVDGDIEALSTVMTRWLKENGRLRSPKFFTGESYGGFRGPLLAEKLQTDHGVGLSGLVLLSPVLDFGWRS